MARGGALAGTVLAGNVLANAAQSARRIDQAAAGWAAAGRNERLCRIEVSTPWTALTRPLPAGNRTDGVATQAELPSKLALRTTAIGQQPGYFVDDVRGDHGKGLWDRA